MKKFLKENYQQNDNENPPKDAYFNYCPYVVLKHIVQYLNFRDLSSFARTCRRWLDAANHEKCLRRWDCFNIISEKGFNFDRIKQSTIKPFLGFFFVAYDITPHERYINSRFIMDFVSELLPTNCKAIMLFADFIIFNKEINTNKIKYRYYHAYFNLLCALSPQIPNIELSIVIITSTQEDRYGEYTQMIERAYEQNHETSACLMVFCSHDNTSIKIKTAQIAHSRFGNSKKTVSFYGAEVHKLQTNIQTVNNLYCIALLITGSIQTWSVCMEHINQTTKLIKEKLKLFQEQVKLQKHSMGFVFTSVKQSSDIQEYLTIFKELFVNVPLIGCYSFSIFGRDTIKERVILIKESL